MKYETIQNVCIPNYVFKVYIFFKCFKRYTSLNILEKKFNMPHYCITIIKSIKGYNITKMVE